jgi:S1-C subfamily serine protease
VNQAKLTQENFRGGAALTQPNVNIPPSSRNVPHLPAGGGASIFRPFMIRSFWRVFAVCVVLFPVHSGFAQPAEVRKSIARITNTAQEPNYRIPWLPGQVGGGSGTGWVVAGERLVTNAHVVSNARFLTVEKENDPKKYVATVEHIAHDCDLALLKLDDPAFFKGTKPLDIGGIPELETVVAVYGYPIGGERMSVTQGVVSRVDFRTYTHSVVDQHLTVQIDAAINPGNSGGPVMQDGKVVGVAFQGYSGDVAQNVGYMIPTPVIKHFLHDVKDGHYDRYMDLSMSFSNTLNPAMRRALGLPDDDRGVMVTTVQKAGVCNGILQPGDVLLSIDGHEIASDGMVELENEHVLLSEVAERKYLGDTVKFSIMRDKKQQDVEVKFDRAWPYTLQANSYDVTPPYILFGGLLFQPLSRNLLGTYNFENLRINYFYDYFITKELYQDHPELIILSAILPDPLNTYLGEFREGIVDEINDKKIKTLKDAATAFGENTEFYVIKFIGASRPLVLERAAVQAARERIKQRYNVLEEQNLTTDASPAS